MTFKFIFLMFVTVSSVFCKYESVKRCTRATGACDLTAEATEGPYYWNSTVRQNITEGKGGVPLRLNITVLDTTTCLPLSNAVVDIWHCDADGIYSHYINASEGHGGQTDNSTFLRGQQLTNEQGVAVLNTIYPGWYRGRATHIHVKVHINATLVNIDGIIYIKGGHVSHTGQLFFDDILTDEVAKLSPYDSHKIHRTRNWEDGIYRHSQGSTTIVPIQFLTPDRFQGPVRGDITLGVNPNVIPPPSVKRPRPSSGH